MAIVDSYSESNQSADASIREVHPSTEYYPYVSARHQSFACSETAPLGSCKFLLKKTGSPVGNLKAALYTHSGTYGESSMPTGSPLAISTNSIAMESLTTGYVLYLFTFDGTYVLQSGTKYEIVVYASDATTLDTTTNYVMAGCDNSSPTHSGNAGLYHYSTWNYDTSYDLCFYVYSGSISKTVADSISLSEVTPLTNKTLVVPDSMGFTELTRYPSKTLIPTELIELLESVGVIPLEPELSVTMTEYGDFIFECGTYDYSEHGLLKIGDMLEDATKIVYITQTSYFKQIFDSIGLADSPTIFDIIKHVTDSTTLTEVINAIKSTGVLVEDTIKITMQSLIVSPKVKAVEDAISLGEFVFATKLKVIRDFILSSETVIPDLQYQCNLHFPLNEGVGTEATDHSGKNNDGTIYGASWTTGKYGKGLHFDGENDYLSFPKVLPTNAITVSCWVKLDEVDVGSHQRIIQITNDSGVGGFSLQEEDGIWHFWVYISGAWYEASKSGADTNLHNLIATYDGSTIRIYVDNVEGTPYDKSGTINDPAGTAVSRMMRDCYDVYTDGLLDDPRIYYSVLSSAQRKSLYEGSDKIRTDKDLKIIDSLNLSESSLADKLVFVQDLTALTDIINFPAVIVEDSIGLSEFLQTTKNIKIVDNISLSDFAGIFRNIVITDALGLSDAAPKIVKFLIVPDLMQISDQATRISKFLSVIDSLQLSGIIKVNKVIITQDDLVIVDSAIRSGEEEVVKLILIAQSGKIILYAEKGEVILKGSKGDVILA